MFKNLVLLIALVSVLRVSHAQNHQPVPTSSSDLSPEGFKDQASFQGFVSTHIAPQDNILSIYPGCTRFKPTMEKIKSLLNREFDEAARPIEKWPRTELYYKTASGNRWWVIICDRQKSEVSAISALLQPNMFTEGDRIVEQGITLLRLDRKEGPLFEGKDTTRPHLNVRLHPLFTPAGLATDIQGIPGDKNFLLVTVKNGRLQLCSISESTCKEILHLDVADVSELGLLGIAFHPQFHKNRKVYLRYDIPAGTGYKNRVSEFVFPRDSLETLDPKSEKIIFEADQPTAFHSGGQIAFGPDGMLYISLGDPNSVGVRSLRSPRGKILRIKVLSPREGNNAGPFYEIPKDNPFIGNKGALGEIWAWGLRNPWRFAFDTKGRIWTGDVGENTKEEISIVERGRDYGWNIFEGSECFKEKPECKIIKDDVKPFHEYGRDEGNAVIGGTFVDNKNAGLLTGKYLFGDGVSGRIWAIEPKGAKLGTAPEVFSLGRWPIFISTFGKTGSGDVVVASFLGPIYRIEPIQP